MKSVISFFLLVLGTQFVVFSTPICNPPTNITNTDISQFSASYTWTPGGTETEWEVGIKKIDATVWLTTMVTAPTHTFLGTQYQIAAMVYGPGTISPSGIVYVNEGENQLFTFTPESNSLLYQLRIDNEEVPFSNNQFEFLNVNAHHVIEVVFVLETLENSIPDLISLSPNPTSGTIEIMIEKTQLQVKVCSIYDMYGKLIKVIPITSDRSTIELSDFSSGVYILRLQSESGSISKIVIKK